VELLVRPASWLNWLLPPRCGGCRALGSWLCERCRWRVRPLEDPICQRCGRELEHARGSAGCGCRARLQVLRRLRSAAAYEGPLEQALHRFKYEGWRALAPALAGLAGARLASELPPSSLVIPVPLHPRRRKERGYNQSELIVRELRRELGLPVATGRGAPGRLLRLRDTPPQVGLDRPRRRQNVAGAFAWRGPPLTGRHVVLVDDVATTGATLEACAIPLREAGAGLVTAVTVARVSA
jgi:ComF family protein